MRSPSIDSARTVDHKNSYEAVIEIPTSKSRANRLLFLAAIDPRVIKIEGVPNSSDVEDMLRCLRLLGLEIERPTQSSVIVKNHFPSCEKDLEEPLVIECGYGGTTTRFLCALLALGQKRYHLEAQGHMRNRPMDEIINSLGSLGVDIEFNKNNIWLAIKGPVANRMKVLEVDSSRSTQFASALAMCASTWGGIVKPLNMKASEDYFSMTMDCIEECKKESSWEVPADFSSLSYPLALAAINGCVNVTNVNEVDNFQPDSILIEILKELGADVEFNKNGLTVKKNDLKAWSGDCSGFPDLVPTLALLCSFAKGESTLRNLDILRHKESDRLHEVEKILKLFNVDVVIDDDSLKIYGVKERQSTFVDYYAPDDHRMIMIAAIFMRLSSGGRINNWDHVKKSYTTFFEDVIDNE